MLLIIIFLFFDIYIFTKIMLKNSFYAKYISFFLLFNLVILIISYIAPYDLYKVSDNVYLLYLLYIFCYSISYIIVCKKTENKTNDNKNNREIIILKIKQFTNKKISKIIISILTLILLYYYMRYLKFTSNIEDKALLRGLFFTDFFNSYTEDLIYNNIICSLSSIAAIFNAIMLTNNIKKNYFFYCSTICLILTTLIGSGRMNLFFYILYCIISFLFLNNISKEKLLKKIKSISKLIVIFLFIFIISLYAISVRMGNLSNIYLLLENQIEQIVIYFTGSFRALEHYLKYGFETLNNYTIYKATFGGLEDIISLFLNFIGIKHSSFNTLVGGITQSYIYIGNTAEFNAFYTCIMNFYADLGVVGVIFYSILFGYITSIIVKKAENSKLVFNTILMIFFTVNINISSIYRWHLQSMAITCAIIIIIFIIILEKKGEKNENTMDS